MCNIIDSEECYLKCYVGVCLTEALDGRYFVASIGMKYVSLCSRRPGFLRACGVA